MKHKIKKLVSFSLLCGLSSYLFGSPYYAHVQPVNPSYQHNVDHYVQVVDYSPNYSNDEYYANDKEVQNRLNIRSTHLQTVKYEQQNSKNISGVCAQLADRLLMSSRIPYNRLGDIAITSFVDLHQLNKTTHFGRIVGETMFDELFTRGFNVTDFRGQSTLSVNANGEYFITRDINQMRNNIQNQYVLVGTYSISNDNIIVNARIIDNQSGTIVASAKSTYVSNDCKILENCPAPRKIKIITDGCSTVECPSKSCPTGICEDDRYNMSHHKIERKLNITSTEACDNCKENSIHALSKTNNTYNYLNQCANGDKNCENRIVIDSKINHSKNELNKNNYTLSLVR